MHSALSFRRLPCVVARRLFQASILCSFVYSLTVVAQPDTALADDSRSSLEGPAGERIRWCKSDCGTGERFDFREQDAKATQAGRLAKTGSSPSSDRDVQPMSKDEQANLVKELQKAEQTQQDEAVDQATAMLLSFFQFEQDNMQRQAEELHRRFFRSTPSMNPQLRSGSRPNTQRQTFGFRTQTYGNQPSYGRANPGNEPELEALRALFQILQAP